MLNFIKNLRNDEAGAVTVDWVVLTAAIVGIGVAAVAAVSGGVNNVGNSIQTKLNNAANNT